MVVEEVRDAVRSGGLLAGPLPVVAMVSAGRDSTCLLDVAVALRGAAAVTALHVNYALRDAADGDERACRELCERLGVELDVVRPQRPADSAGAPEGGNLQAWARRVRYEAARELAASRRSAIATGHTASDQVETILYRLAASPGRRALLGMREREGPLVRPLLGVSRARTAEYCRERGLAWREDESNADPRFARARVRAGLLPALAAVHPAAAENVLRTAQLLREETALIDSLVEDELGGGAGIPIERLAALPPALARTVVVRLAEDAAGTYVPQAGDRVAELVALGRRGGRAELHLGGLAGAVIEDGVLSMVKLPPRGAQGRAGEH
jgi:tRNA(Ile)-lysidine synthase